jgi:hypothetical protein
MLNNALTAKDHTGAAITMSLVDTDDGRTIRTLNMGAGNKIDLTIANTESSENKGILSDRFLVRLDMTKVEATSPYAPAKASAYLNIVVPRRPDFDTVEVISLAERLLSLLQAEASSDLTTFGTLERIIAGEK